MMDGVNFKRTYWLGDGYEGVKDRAAEWLGNYLGDQGLIQFDEVDRRVTFTSERLIPIYATGRPRVILLFSNPHPHSIQQEMFLSPNTKGRENLFWQVMAEAGWILLPDGYRSPRQLAEVCLKAEYGGPFELVFYPYYAFPTDYPEHIKKIFGREFFREVIEVEAEREFREILRESEVETVVAFNKGIFNLVAEESVAKYIQRLIDGEVVRSRVKGVDGDIPVFLTFPTGWRFQKGYMALRRGNLERIGRKIMEAGVR